MGEEGVLAFEGLNVEFCEDNSGRSKKMRYFRTNIKGGGGGGGGGEGAPLDPPLILKGSYIKVSRNCCSFGIPWCCMDV